MIIVTKSAFNRLSAKTKTELMSAVFGTSLSSLPLPDDVQMSDFDWSNRAKLTPGEVETFIDDSTNMHAGTIKGLEIIAEFGPIIHSSQLLEKLKDEAGVALIDDLGTFQRSTTRRVRSVTGDKSAFLLAWNDWVDGEGYYAVTAETHRSLQVYFELV
jgi:hypothetical protein